MAKSIAHHRSLKPTAERTTGLDCPHAPVAPISLVETRDGDPYPAYAAARALGDVVWDEGMAAWLVLDHKGCAFVETREDLFAEFTGTMPGADRLTGPHEFRLLVGEPHQRLHHYLARRWLPEAIEPYRAAFVQPIVETRITALRSAGRAELWTDFASVVPVAVMGRVIGLPAMREEDLRRAKGFTDAVLAWRHSYGSDQAKMDAAIEANRELERAILPIVRARRAAPQDDLISGLWEVGPSVVETWNEQDVLDNVKPLFEAGAETTSLLICLAMHLALGNAQLRASIRGGGEPLRRFVDETLRHTTVIHWRARVAVQDIELGGVTIRAGDRVHPVNAAANRDPVKHRDPDHFDLGRKGYLGHLAFNVGPRHCAGAWLARMEAYESISALLALPNLRLDPDAESPRMSGFVSRTFRPLHVRLD
jgi:cytochrome P450